MIKRMFQLLAVTAALLLGVSRSMAQEHGATHDAAATVEKAADKVAGEAKETAHQATGEATEAGAHHGGGHESQPLVPDLASKETWMQALWTVIIFVVMLVILIPTAFKNVLAGLKARESKIRKDIADAEAASAKAQATLKDYNAQLATADAKVRELLTKATADGEALATSIRSKAQAEAEEIKNRTNREIEASKNAAIQEIHTYTADLATSIAAKILQKNLNVEDQRELVNRSLEQLQSVKN